MSLAESFARSPFAGFMNAPSGRLARIIAGIALMALGYAQRDGAAGPILFAVALVPLGTGAFDLCVISALLGGPLSGAAIRKGVA